MDPEETREMINPGIVIASLQESGITVQVEDWAEISIVGTNTAPEPATSPRITATLQSTAASNEDTIASESTVDTTPENAMMSHPNLNTISQNHVSTTLKNNTAALGETASTGDPGDNVTFGNNHASNSKETSKSISGEAIVSCREISSLFKEDTLNTPRNNNNSTAFGKVPKKGYLISTSSGDNTSSTIETITVLGNIINSNTTGDTFYKAPRNTATDEGNKYNLSEKTITILSSGDVRETSISKEKTTPDIENPTITPNSINALENTSAAGYIAITGSGDNTTRGDTITTPPGKVNQIELAVSAGKEAREILNTALKKSCGDTTTVASFRNSTVNPISVGTKTTATQGNAFTNTVGNVTAGNVSATCESTIVFKEEASTTSDKNAALRHSTTIDGFGNDAIYGNYTGTTYREINQSLFDGGTITTASGETFGASQDTISNVPGYFTTTTTTSSQDTKGYSTDIELRKTSEIITGETTIAFENATITHGDTATSDATHTIPTNITVTEAARQPIDRNTATILEDGNTATSMRSAPVPQNTGGTMSEDIIATTASKGAIKSMATRETSTINFEKEMVTPTTSAAITSVAPRDTGGDVMNVASGNGATSASGQFSTTVPTETPILLGKTTTHSGRSNTNFMSEVSKTAADSADTTGSNITANPSEIVTSSKGINDIMTSAYGVTATTLTTSLGKMSGFRGNRTLTEAAPSAVTMRIHASTSGGGNTLLEELITSDLSSRSSVDVTPGTFPFSKGMTVLDFTSTYGDTHNRSVSPDITSTHDTTQDRKFSADTTAGDSKIPSDTVTVVPGATNSNSGPVPNISLLLEETNTDAVEETSTNAAGSVFLNTNSSGDPSVETPEEMYYVEGIISVHSGTTIVLGHISTPNSSFSIGTGTQEASTYPGDTTSAFGYITNIMEGATLEETHASVHSEIPTTLEQESNFNKTTTEATMLTERSLTENATSTSGDRNKHTPMVGGTENVASYMDAVSLYSSVSTASSATSVTLSTSEAISTPEDARHTTDSRGIDYVLATGDTISIATSVGPNISPTNKPRESPAVNPLEDFAKTTTLSEDSFIIASTAMRTTSTGAALRDTLMATQAFPGDIAIGSRDKFANTIQESPKFGETVTSETIVTSNLEDTRTHSEALPLGTRTEEAHILKNTPDPVANIIPKENLSIYSSDYYKTTDAPDAQNYRNTPASTNSTLSDSVSSPDSATSVFETTTSSERILTSRNDSTATSVSISIQNQATISESPTTVPDKFCFATGENVTTIATSETQTVTRENTMANILDGIVTNNVTFTSSPENVTHITSPCVSPIDLSAAPNVPWDTMTLAPALEEALPPSGNTSCVTTPLGEVSPRSDSCSPAEPFSTLASSLHGDPGHLLSPNLSTISSLGDTSRIPGRGLTFGNPITSTLFVEGTDLSIDTGNTTGSSITIAPGAATILGRTNTNESRGTNASGHNHTTSEATDDSAAALSNGKYVITSIMSPGEITAIVPGDATTAPGDTNIDNSAPGGTSITTALGDIHSTAVTACGVVANPIRDNTGPEKRIRKVSSSMLEDISSIQYEASTTNYPRPYRKRSISESTCLPVANLATRGTFVSDFSQAVINLDTAELKNTIDDTTTAHSENSASASGGIVSEDLSTSGVAISLAETPITEVNSMDEMNLKEVANTTSRPTALTEDAVLIPFDAAITLADDIAISHSETASLRKPKELSLSAICSAESVLGTATDPRDIISSVTPGTYSMRETPSIGTILAVAEAHSSQVTSPLEGIAALGPTTAPEDPDTKAAITDIRKAPMSGAKIALGKYSTSEAKTVLGGITSSGIISSPRQTFAHETTSFTETPISTSAIGIISEAIIIPVKTSTHGATCFSEQMDTSGNVPFIQITDTAEITSMTTTINSTSSSGNIIFTPFINNKTDEALSSGKVATISVHGETFRPRASSLPQRALIAEDGAPFSVSRHPNTPENTSPAPENANTTVLEDTTIVFGSNSTAPDVVTTLDNSNDTPNRESSNTMRGTLIASSAKEPTSKSRGTTTIENKVSTPGEIKIVPGEASIITPEETNPAISRKSSDIITEIPMSTVQTNGTRSGESLPAPPGEVNIATFQKTIEPTTVGSPMAPNETVAISPQETFSAAIFRKTTDTTEDAHPHTLTTLEESLIDTPSVEVIVTQAGNTTETTTQETPTAVYEPTTIIHRKLSATVPRKTPTTPTSGAHPAFPPDEIPATVEATTTHKEIFPAAPKENTPIASTPKKTPMDTPRGITSASQRKANTIKPVIPLSYWSVTLIGITVILVLAVGLCMVIYYVTFVILVTYSTS